MRHKTKWTFLVNSSILESDFKRMYTIIHSTTSIQLQRWKRIKRNLLYFSRLKYWADTKHIYSCIVEHKKTRLSRETLPFNRQPNWLNIHELKWGSSRSFLMIISWEVCSSTQDCPLTIFSPIWRLCRVHNLIWYILTIRNKTLLLIQ